MVRNSPQFESSSPSELLSRQLPRDFAKLLHKMETIGLHGV